MLGAEFRFESASALLRRVVQSGAIGTPRHFLRIHHQPGLQDATDKLSDWWEDADQGGGFLGAFGSHMIDQIEYMFGPIARVSGMLQTLAPGRPKMTADDCYSLQFETASGVSGSIIAALAAPGPLVMATKVVGSAGGAWIQSGANYGDPEEVWVSDADGARRIELPEELVNAKPSAFPFAELIQTEQDRWHTMGHDVPPYARLFAEMRARIENQTPAISERAATFDDAARGQAVLDAIRASARQGVWITL